MSTSTEMTRYALLSIVAARGQEVCVAYVNGQDRSESIEALFGALSKLQEFDDRHADDGPSVSRGVSQKLIEQLADAEHASWAHWMEYLFSRCVRDDRGVLTIPTHLVMHWQRQIDTPYADLSEREKQSDRDEVAKIVPFIEVEIASRSTGGE